jgi:hypothetical protein
MDFLVNLPFKIYISFLNNIVLTVTVGNILPQYFLKFHIHNLNLYNSTPYITDGFLTCVTSFFSLPPKIWSLDFWTSRLKLPSSICIHILSSISSLRYMLLYLIFHDSISNQNKIFLDTTFIFVASYMALFQLNWYF